MTNFVKRKLEKMNKLIELYDEFISIINKLDLNSEIPLYVDTRYNGLFIRINKIDDIEDDIPLSFTEINRLNEIINYFWYYFKGSFKKDMKIIKNEIVIRTKYNGTHLDKGLNCIDYIKTIKYISHCENCYSFLDFCMKACIDVGINNSKYPIVPTIPTIELDVDLESILEKELNK